VRIIGRVSLQDVHDALWRSRTRTEGSGPWTGPLLDTADAQLGPDWWDVELDGPEAAAIVLPWHAGEACRGDRLTLIGAGGLTVAAAAARLAAIETDYARENRSCWSRIATARAEPLTRVILATAPIDHEEYRGLAPGPHLYCLDGRHRLIGWALEGALAAGAIVPAHVVAALGRSHSTGCENAEREHREIEGTERRRIPP